MTWMGACLTQVLVLGTVHLNGMPADFKPAAPDSVRISHKPRFDQWLGQLQGVEIVDAARILR